jgi:protein involved in polysaccharide export with SLBB domain
MVEKVMTKKSWISFISIALVLVVAQAVGAAQTGSQSATDNVPAPTPAAPQASVPTPASSPTTASTIPSGSAPQLQTRDPRYRLAASDSFDLTFPLSPEYNQLAVTVQPDGFVTLFSVGDVKVQGQTVPELTDTVRNAYGKILHDPIVSIALKDFNKPYFIADGQVGHPGKYDLREETTLSQAIAIAGGFTEDAKHSQVILVHRVGDQYVSAQIFDVKKMEAKGDLREDPYVHPGDQILVPKNLSSKLKGWMPSYGVGGYIPIK